MLDIVYPIYRRAVVFEAPGGEYHIVSFRGGGLIIGVFTLDINGILGFLLTLIGLTVIGIGLF